MSMEWYQQLNRRERAVLLFGSLFSLTLLLYLTLWKPLFESNTRLKQQLIQNQHTHVWLQAAAEEVQTLRKNLPTKPQSINEYQLLQQQARKFNLQMQLRETVPGSFQATLEQVPFNNLLKWLDATAKLGAEAQVISIRKAEAIGQVDARLNLSYSP